MAKPGKLQEVPVPEGMTLGEYFAKRLNDLGSVEKLAQELGVSYPTAWAWVTAAGVKKRFHYVAEPEKEASGA